MTETETPTSGILDAWFSQKPTFALMGEFSAGKSTLLNLLLEDEVLTTQVTATKLPVIWITHGETVSASCLTVDGAFEPFDMKDLDQLGAKNPLLLRLSFPAEILKRIDIIDTPGISDPRLAAGALSFLGPYLDFVVWCSAANQAWRQTEKAMWTSLPEGLRSTSILALTRADTVSKAGDLKKVVKRCTRETADLFDQIVPIAAMTALKARGVDEAGWDQSNAPALLSAIEVAIERAEKACEGRTPIATPQQPAPPAPKASAEPKKPATAKPKKKAAAKPKRAPAKAAPKKVAKAAPKAQPKAVSNAEFTKLIGALRAQNSTDKGEKLKEQFVSKIEHFFGTFLSEKNLSDEHHAVLQRAMSLGGSSNVSSDAISLQLVREIEDFTNSSWCTLDQIH